MKPFIIAFLLTLALMLTTTVTKPKEIRNEPVQSKVSIIQPLEAKVYAQKQPIAPIAPKTAPVASGGSHSDLMRQAGIAESDFTYVEYIIQKESGWNYLAKNPGSSATGLCQTMLSIHKVSDTFRSNPIEQLQWCSDYAQRRYNGWAGAYNFWLRNHWW